MKFVVLYGCLNSCVQIVVSCPSRCSGANSGVLICLLAVPIVSWQLHSGVHVYVIPCLGVGIVCVVPLLVCASVSIFSISVAIMICVFCSLISCCLYVMFRKNVSMSAPAIRTSIQWNYISNPFLLFNLHPFAYFCR